MPFASQSKQDNMDAMATDSTAASSPPCLPALDLNFDPVHAFLLARVRQHGEIGEMSGLSFILGRIDEFRYLYNLCAAV